MKIELTINQYESLMRLRDLNNPDYGITQFVKYRFNAIIKHKLVLDDSGDFSTDYSYKSFSYTVIFENDKDLTRFILSV